MKIRKRVKTLVLQVGLSHAVVFRDPLFNLEG
jgi:hypothetical protein